MIRRAGLLLAVVATPVSAAVAAPPQCVSAADAEAMTLVALPEIIRQTGTVCAGRLPAASLVRRADGPFIAKYQTAADRAWPAARAALAKLSDPMIQPLLESDYVRPVLTSLIVPLLVGRIAPADCGIIDQLVTQLAPLPPRNTATVVVTALRYLKAEKAKGKPIEVPDLPLCALPR